MDTVDDGKGELFRSVALQVGIENVESERHYLYRQLV